MIFILFLSLALASPLLGDSSATNLERHVRHLADGSEYRNYQNINRLNAIAEYIQKQLESYGYIVYLQEYRVQGQTYKNVYVKLGAGKNNLMVMGAHYDVCYDTPGADDNASGVAGLLEIARLLKVQEKHLPRPVELVFFTLEEPPFFGTEDMGSARHALSLKEQGVQVDLMISIEMIGRFSDEQNSQSYPIDALAMIYPSVGNYIALVGRLSDRQQLKRVNAAMQLGIQNHLPIQSIALPRLIQGVSFSDHYQYWDQGFPAIMVTDTAFLRNHDYHTKADTADKLDYQKMSVVVNGLLQVPFQYRLSSQ